MIRGRSSLIQLAFALCVAIAAVELFAIGWQRRPRKRARKPRARRRRGRSHVRGRSESVRANLRFDRPAASRMRRRVLGLSNARQRAIDLSVAKQRANLRARQLQRAIRRLRQRRERRMRNTHDDRPSLRQMRNAMQPRALLRAVELGRLRLHVLADLRFPRVSERHRRRRVRRPHERQPKLRRMREIMRDPERHRQV